MKLSNKIYKKKQRLYQENDVQPEQQDSWLIFHSTPQDWMLYPQSFFPIQSQPNNRVNSITQMAISPSYFKTCSPS